MARKTSTRGQDSTEDEAQEIASADSVESAVVAGIAAPGASHSSTYVPQQVGVIAGEYAIRMGEQQPLTAEDLAEVARVPDVVVMPGGKAIPVFPEETVEIARLVALGGSHVRKNG